MPELTPYSLSFQSGLHIGTRGVNLEEAGVSVPSDTLFAALVDAWNRGGGRAEDFARPFTSDPPQPPFLLTSAFPRVGQVRFYPLPVDRIRIFNQKTLSSRSKEVKHIRYFSEGLLEKALLGKKLDDDLFPEDEFENPKTGVDLQGGVFWLTVNEIERLPDTFRRPMNRLRSLRYLNVWKSERVPRVTISRITSASNIFHSGRVIFAEGCGLWFGVEWRLPEAPVIEGDQFSFLQAFDRALAMLRDDGLGGERTSGYGAFTSRAEDSKNLPVPIAGQPAILLGRYHPRQQELPDVLTAMGTAYSLTAVAGWLHTLSGPDQRRKRLNLVVEGSLIAFPGAPAGEVINVRPEYDQASPGVPHSVWRSGLALALGWPVSDQPEAKHA